MYSVDPLKSLGGKPKWVNNSSEIGLDDTVMTALQKQLKWTDGVKTSQGCQSGRVMDALL
jgi:hypothetical protein